MLRGKEKEADEIVREIEAKVESEKGQLPKAEGVLKISVRDYTPLRDVWKAMIHDQPETIVTGLGLDDRTVVLL